MFQVDSPCRTSHSAGVPSADGMAGDAAFDDDTFDETGSWLDKAPGDMPRSLLSNC
jgi:hypothetical protein